jgi:hypothetical protein
MSVNNLRLDNLPCFDLVSALTKIPSLRLADIDQHLPSQINFNYYSGAEFLNNQDILDLSTKKLLEYYIAILEVLQLILIKFLFY